MKKIILLLIFFIMTTSVVKSAWEIETIYGSQLLTFVSKLSDNRLILNSDMNRILISDFNQESWKSIFFNHNFNFKKCLILDDKNLLFAGYHIDNSYDSKVYKLNINTEETNEFINYNDVAYMAIGIVKIPNNEVFLSFGAKNMYYSFAPVIYLENNTNGKREEIVFDEYINESMMSVFALNELTYVALSLTKSTCRVLRTEDGGKTWNETFFAENIEAQRFNFFNNEIGLIVGNYGVLYKTEDGGKTWKNIYNSTSFVHNSHCITDAYFLDKDRIILAGADKVTNEGVIYYSKNGGLDWDIKYRTKQGSLYTVTVIEDTVFVFGRNGIMVKGSLDDLGDIAETPLKSTLLYPNPASSTCTISGNLSTLVQDFSITISDINGKELFEVCKHQNLEGEFSFSFDTKSLPSGSYNVILNADGKKQIEKLIIER